MLKLLLFELILRTLDSFVGGFFSVIFRYILSICVSHDPMDIGNVHNLFVTSICVFDYNLSRND